MGFAGAAAGTFKLHSYTNRITVSHRVSKLGMVGLGEVAEDGRGLRAANISKMAATKNTALICNDYVVISLET